MLSIEEEGKLKALAGKVDGDVHVYFNNHFSGYAVQNAQTLMDFLDVPQGSPYHAPVETIIRDGITSGCGGGNYCPTANVSREQMSVFLAVTFGLTLYGI